MSVYNFTPSGYINTFLNVTLNTGGPTIGFSATEPGIQEWLNGQPVTEPYSYYAGWTFSSPGIDASVQEYDRIGDGEWTYLPGNNQ